MSFERRAERLEQLFTQRGEAPGNSSRGEWRALFCAIMDEFESLVRESKAPPASRSRHDSLEQATRKVVAERYAHVDQEEREQLTRELLSLWEWWESVDIDEVRADRRLLLPPSLRDA
jgi:hypothetical protein